MPTFRELLTASDTELVRIFYKVKPDPDDTFVSSINKVASELGVNHAQLICALGFNKNIRELTDIVFVMGFRSYKQLSYRRNELFSTDTYQQLSIDNILDIYSERLEDEEIKATLRELLPRRLTYIENDVEKTQDPSTIISYRMEIHAIYTSGIPDKAFCEQRAGKRSLYPFRKLTDEILAIAESGILPASNLFYMDEVAPQEKKQLVEKSYVPKSMVENRLKNTSLSDKERGILENLV